jgi:hypothetical protein
MMRLSFTRQENPNKYLVCHFGNKLMKIGKGLVDIDDMGPIAFLDVSSAGMSGARFNGLEVLPLRLDVRL